MDGEAVNDAWSWNYSAYDPHTERLVESLCTVGNGRFATRGSAPECAADDAHYPGTYMAGCYNRLTSTVAGRTVENEDLVNLPNWTLLRYRCLPEDGPPGEWLTPDSADLRRSTTHLDLRAGVLTRRLLYRDAAGRGLRVAHQRFVHMGNPWLAAQRSAFRAYGWSGRIEVESILDGTVTNAGVRRYGDLDGQHLTAHRKGAEPGGVAWLTCRTVQSAVLLALAVRTTSSPARPAEYVHAARAAVQRFVLPVSPGNSVTVAKTVALHTSLDRPAGDPLAAALESLAHAPVFGRLLRSHRSAWRRMWNQAELDVPGRSGHILRLHLFHLLQTLSPHTAELDVGVPARGLHGEAYRGHVFWDELFVLPYLTLHFPEVARAMLMYRHRRLPAARAAARRTGARGAMYPWQSAGSGREETQAMHLNPASGRWLPDHSHLQRHVGSAVAFNAWRYAQAAGDPGFLHSAGADILLEVARYWASAAAFDPGRGRYRLRGVVGPDEYHDAYPGADRPGIDDNAYTNAMAAWVLSRALEVFDALPGPRREELAERLAIDTQEHARWDDVSRRLYMPFHHGVLSQFEGYGDLEELDWERYRRLYPDIRRLDRILEAEGDSVNNYQASKQADALMLGHLFRPAELTALFGRLGYRIDDEIWSRTVAYYLPRTSHGSTLSSLVHGWVLARQKGPDAWKYVEEALLSDVADIQGGTTGEGIHLGAMAGTLDLVARGITGLEPGEQGLRIDPVALREIPRFSFTLCFRGHNGVRLRLLPGRIGVSVPPSPQGSLVVLLPEGRSVTVPPGREHWFRLPTRASR